MIEVKGVSKWYGTLKALNQVSFSVDKGQIVGFLGPNGAGKTTMMKILTTFLYPDEGEVKVCDLDIWQDPLEVRRRIGYLAEHRPLYDSMGVYQFLKFIAEARGVPRHELKKRVDVAIERCGLVGYEKRIISTLSKGYKQRVGLAQALVHEPDVLILDEPTTGFDPNQILEIRQVIRELGKDHTILLSTHILSEVQALCERVILIHRGNVVIDDLLSNLTGTSNVYFGLLKGDLEKLRQSLQKIEGVEEVSLRPVEEGLQFTLKAKEGTPHLGEKIFQAVLEAEGIILELEREKRSLEAIFQEATKN